MQAAVWSSPVTLWVWPASLVCKFPGGESCVPLNAQPGAVLAGDWGRGVPPEPGWDLGSRVGPGRKRQPGVSAGWASLALAGLEASLEKNFPATSYLCLLCGRNIASEDRLCSSLPQNPASQGERGDPAGCLHLGGGGSTSSYSIRVWFFSLRKRAHWCPGKKAWLSWVTTCSLAIAV